VGVERQLSEFVRRVFGEMGEITIEGLEPIPGGFSRETFRFDARIDGVLHPMILRKDPPAAAALLTTSRQVEHDLIETVRLRTTVPVPRSYGAEMDPSHFGEPAMLLERAPGSGHTSDLFHDGPHADQADEVIGHLCETLAELHLADIEELGLHEALHDPRGVGIDTSSWDAYMDSTFEYYLSSYPDIAYDPTTMVLLDAFLTLRRHKPRPLRLSLVHGDFNPANFLYAGGRVTALIDWENARVGDPREDLGWMVAMDGMSNTTVMAHPRDRGGFLAYYNELTGFGVTPEELGYFTLFGTSNISVPIATAVKRRVDREHHQILHLYLLQPSATTLVGLTQLLGYPGAPA
jgi:aminoglycoside phosphotransferase (APT) family kinase protein